MAKKPLAKNNIIYSVSVIMPSYLSGPILIRSIQSVLTQKNLKELIIIDNGNCKYVRGKIQEFVNHNSKIRVISGQGNIGFARSCNLAAKEATGNYLLILNPSCILPHNTFEKAIQPLLDNASYWVSGCKILDVNHKEQVGNRRNLLSCANLLSDWFGIYKFMHLSKLELNDEEVTKSVSDVPAISSSFMMMRKETYQQIGQMDKHYFYNIEDLDMCFQIYQMGGKIAFVNNLEIVKYSRNNEISKITLDKHIAKSLIYYFKKNFNGAYPPGTRTLLSVLIISRFLIQSLISALKLCFKIIFKPFSDKTNINTYVNFVEKYKDFQVPQEHNSQNNIYSLVNREPVLITSIDNQSGAAILQRLLAANIEVIGLYKNTHIDLYHPKLTLIKKSLNSLALDLPKNINIKTVICTSSIQNLPPYIEKLAKIGVKRLISLTNLPISSGTNKQSIAEQDIARICTTQNIDYTILRTSFIYGLETNNWLYSIYLFIKYFKSFPIIEDDFEIYSPVNIDDVAISTLLVLNVNKTYGQTYNLLGGDDKLTYYDIVGKIFEYSNIKISISRSKFKLTIFKLFNKLSANINSRRNITKYIKKSDQLNINKAKFDFNYNPVKFLETNIEDIGINVK